MSAETSPQPLSQLTPQRHAVQLRRLLHIIIGLSLVIYLTALWYGWRDTLRETRTSLTHINSMMVQATRASLTSEQLVLRGLGTELVQLGALEQPERGRAMIERMKAIDSGMVGFGLARPDGQLVLVSGITADTSLPNLLNQPESAESFRRCIESNRIQLGRPYFMALLDQWVAPIRVPIHDQQGKLRAVMTAGYTLDGGNADFAHQKLPAHVSVVLVRDDHYLQYAYPLPAGDPLAVRQRFYGHPIPEAARAQMAHLNDMQGFTTFYMPRLDRTDYTVYQRLPEQALTVGTLFPRDEVVKNWLGRILGPTALLLLFVGGSLYGFRRSMRRLVLSDAELLNSAKAIEDSNARLKLINKLSNRLHQCLEVQAVVKETMDVLIEQEAPPYATFHLLDGASGNLRMRASHGLDTLSQKAAARIPLDGSLSAQAFRAGQILLIRDMKGDERILPNLRAMITASNIKSGIVIPLTYNGESIGIINLLYDTPQDWSEAEIDTLLALSRAVSLAIANTRHVDDLEYQARHDPLTGLANRSVLHDRFRELVKSAPDTCYTLMLLDLDRFKEINDTLGHHAGDLLLCEIGPRLAAVLGDFEHLLVRLGGDEFALLTSGIDDPDAALKLAYRLIEAIRQPFNVEGMSLELGGSFGVAIYPEHGSDSQKLLRAADVAMYEAKRTGAGALLYESSFDKHSPERLALMLELGPAIREGQMLVHFQPKLDLKKGNVSGFEALVRWQHPSRGLLYPDRFMPMAETSRAIHSLTESVLRLALAQQRAWKAAGHRFNVSVNLSTRNLVDDRLHETLCELIAEYGVEAGDLEMEVTESALMHDPEGAITLLKRITSLGINLSIDDFGTGFSSLAYLRRMPISALKIDRVFVMDMLANPQDEIIVRSTIGLAHNLGIKVIAEGVENAETQQALADMGCDQIQGYHLSKPKPWGELADWLADFHQASAGN